MPEVPVNAARMPVATCPACGASAELVTPEHRADPDAAVVCPPDSGCCQADHSHGECRPLIIQAFAHLIGEAGH